MPRSRRVASASSARRRSRDRHGRGMRSPVTGPHLEPLRTRIEEFDVTVASTAAYLRGLWPDLEGVVFQVADAPAEAIHDDHVDRWKVLHDERRIVFFRLPIVRFLRTQEGEEKDEKLLIESCVFRAVADFLGRDPWELAPGRYRHL
ncbi:MULTISPECIES: metallopeptidase family protein [Agromyces]|uniref:Metallopeptidase family protein n=1 Tax=Agromyces indicus TaxID=758919 RepID=A0ABU1FNI8_9MICO|nr:MULTISPECIES: metallopeptidase family protein [Agromyces]MCK8608688.1 metallopeptidase family protein [Agromyces sp. C10]MDR5693324.1 metallopeptidase family protein [Agromyces indicus]